MVSKEGKASETEFKLLENFNEASFVEVFPHTGRTHQIRVHSAYLNHPIIGDTKYSRGSFLGKSEINCKRLLFTCTFHSFYPKWKRYFFQAELDKEFQNDLKLFATKQIREQI